MNNSTHAVRQWTDDDLGFIQDHEDWPIARVAESLGRTPSAVYGKRHQLRSGWTPKRVQQPPWSDSEEGFVIANPDMSDSAIGERLGRSAEAVEARRRKLRQRGTRKQRKNWSPNLVGSRRLLAQTCPKCGLLLADKWFDKTHRGRRAWRSYCSRCVEPRPVEVSDKTRKASRESYAKQQAISLPGATNNGQPWVEEDYRVLQDPELTILEKALVLHRTFGATSAKCHLDGYKSRVGLGDPMREQWVIDNPNAERIEEITEAIISRAEPMTMVPSENNWDWDEDVA